MNCSIRNLFLGFKASAPLAQENDDQTLSKVDLASMKTKFFQDNVFVKNEVIRSKIKEILDLDIAELKKSSKQVYKEVILDKINQLENEDEQIKLKKQIILFNNVCNVLMRKKSHQKLTFQQFQDLVSPIGQKLGLDNVKKIEFVMATFFINFHTHRGNYVNTVFNFIFIIVKSFIGAIIGSILFTVVATFSCGIIHFPIVVLITILSFCFIFYKSVVDYLLYFTPGDSLNCHTNSFKSIKKEFNHGKFLGIGEIIELCLTDSQFYDKINNIIKGDDV